MLFSIRSSARQSSQNIKSTVVSFRTSLFSISIIILAIKSNFKSWIQWPLCQCSPKKRKLKQECRNKGQGLFLKDLKEKFKIQVNQLKRVLQISSFHSFFRKTKSKLTAMVITTNKNKNEIQLKRSSVNECLRIL